VSKVTGVAMSRRGRGDRGRARRRGEQSGDNDEGAEAAHAPTLAWRPDRASRQQGREARDSPQPLFRAQRGRRRAGAIAGTNSAHGTDAVFG
jgi:hypothetical protein